MSTKSTVTALTTRRSAVTFPTVAAAGGVGTSCTPVVESEDNLYLMSPTKQQKFKMELGGSLRMSSSTTAFLLVCLKSTAKFKVDLTRKSENGQAR